METRQFPRKVFPSGIIVGVALAKTTGLLPVYLRTATNNHARQKCEFTQQQGREIR